MRAYLWLLMVLSSLAVCSPTAAHPPYGLVVDPAGNIYFSDLETVWRLTADGRLSVFRPYVPDTHVHELALTADGAIEGDQNRYDPVSRRFYAGLWRRTIGGNEQAIVPMTDRPPPGAGIWQDKAGSRYTAQWISNTDRRTALVRRRRDGRVDVLFDEAGGAARPPQASVASVGGMAFGADGTLFFAVGGVLRRLAADGTVTKWYDGGTRSSLRGIAAAPGGRVLCADMTGKLVLEVRSEGKVKTLYRGNRGWFPTAVALVGGRLIVLEANADPYVFDDRVRLIEVNQGRAKVLAQPGRHEAQQDLTRSSSSERGGPSRRVLYVTLAAAAALFAGWRCCSVVRKEG